MARVIDGRPLKPARPREDWRRLADEAARKIERLRELAAGRDLLGVYEYRDLGDLVTRLRATIATQQQEA